MVVSLGRPPSVLLGFLGRVVVLADAVINRLESPNVANALASLCLRLVAIFLALMLGLALALAIIFALALWYFLPALVPRQ
jgi:uncharacterized membrane protein YjjP (DUF1212 family)